MVTFVKQATRHLKGASIICMKWQRFEDIRIDHDLTQQQVADILNCQREVYRRYEKGIREMPLSYAIILAQYYHVYRDYLTGLSDDSAIH